MDWIGCFCCEMFVPRSHVRIFRNKRTRSTPLDPKLMFWFVSYRLRAFGTVKLPYKTGAKRAELVQKFVPRSRVGIFRNERTRWYETHQNMSLGSNGVDRVRSLRKILTRLRGTNICTSSARFAPIFGYTQIVRNAPK